jgi:spore maturation protein CgeB
LLVGPHWFGDLMSFVERACVATGCEVRCVGLQQSAGERDLSRLTQVVSRIPIAGGRWRSRGLVAIVERNANIFTRTFRDTVESWKPQLLIALVCGGVNTIPADVVREADIPVKVGWVMDDPFDAASNLIDRIDCYDKLYAADSSWAELLRFACQQPVGVLPCGADPKSFRPLDQTSIPQESRCDVAFVGSSYRGHPAGHIRTHLLHRLTRWRLHVYGDAGWASDSLLAPCYRGGPISTEQTNLVFNAAAVVLNIHHSQWHSGTSLRTFAIAAAGRPQIVDWKPGLDQYFMPGDEVATYRSADELAAHVQELLRNQKKATSLAKSAYERVMSEHLYEHRVEHIISESRPKDGWPA